MVEEAMAQVDFAGGEDSGAVVVASGADARLRAVRARQVFFVVPNCTSQLFALNDPPGGATRRLQLSDSVPAASQIPGEPLAETSDFGSLLS